MECESLTNITIPDSVTSIGEFAFSSCRSLTSVTFEGTIAGNNFGERDKYVSFGDSWKSPFDGNLRDKYLAGGQGTYTTTAPVNDNSKWTKQ